MSSIIIYNLQSDGELHKHSYLPSYGHSGNRIIRLFENIYYLTNICNTKYRKLLRFTIEACATKTSV